MKAFVFWTTFFLVLSCGAMYCVVRIDRADRMSRGCNYFPDQKIYRITRVLTDMNGCYELMIEDDPSKEIISYKFCHYFGEYQITNIQRFADVPPEQPMWADFSLNNQDDNGACHYELDIHLHSVKDINGGGWQRTVNKRTESGSVEVIE